MYVRAHSGAINLNLIRENTFKSYIYVSRQMREKKTESPTEHTHEFFLIIDHKDESIILPFHSFSRPANLVSAPVPVRCICQDWRANSRIFIFSHHVKIDTTKKKKQYFCEKCLFVMNIQIHFVQFSFGCAIVSRWIIMYSTAVWCKSVDWCVYLFENCVYLAAINWCIARAWIRILAHMRDNWTK